MGIKQVINAKQTVKHKRKHWQQSTRIEKET